MRPSFKATRPKVQRKMPGRKKQKEFEKAWRKADEEKDPEELSPSSKEKNMKGGPSTRKSSTVCRFVIVS